MLTDTHAHLADERLLPQVEEVVARAAADGVSTIVTVGTNAENSRRCLELAGRFPGVWATAGIHPHAALEADDAALAAVRALLTEPRVVAVGETGLDYHYDFSPRERQRAAFAAHLEMAAETGLPVVVHCREAESDVRAMVAEWRGRAIGILHSFSGGGALLEEALDAGWYASFSGMVTFKKYDAVELLRTVPADRILVETDAPYLAPVPLRGKTNEPGYVVHTARRAAELRGEEPEEFAARTTDNARRLFARMAAEKPAPA